MKFIQRVGEYSVYRDQNILYVESKGDDFAAVFGLPPQVKKSDDVDGALSELLNEKGPYMDMLHRVLRTRGEIQDEYVPRGRQVSERAKTESGAPVSKPPNEPGPPQWAGPGLGGGRPDEPPKPPSERPEVGPPKDPGNNPQFSTMDES